MEPLLTVVIPARNEDHRVQFVIAALKAGIAACGWKWGFEVVCIIVDETDVDTFGRPNYYDTGNDGGIRLISRSYVKPPYTKGNPAKSAAGARTVGVLASHTPAVFLLDAHVIPSDGCWRAIRSHVEQLPNGDLRDSVIHFPGQWWNQAANEVYTHHVLDLEWDFWGRAWLCNKDLQYFPTQPIGIPSFSMDCLLTSRDSYIHLMPPPDLEGYLAGADEIGVDLLAWMTGMRVLLDPRGFVVIHDAGHGYPKSWGSYNRNALYTAYRLGGEEWVKRAANGIRSHGNRRSTDVEEAIDWVLQKASEDNGAEPGTVMSFEEVLYTKPWEAFNLQRGDEAFNQYFRYWYRDDRLVDILRGHRRPGNTDLHHYPTPHNYDHWQQMPKGKRSVDDVPGARRSGAEAIHST